MNKTNAIAVSAVLASFALLGTWAGTMSDAETTNTIGIPMDAAPTPCPYEDQSGGMGGQGGECTFSCQTGGISLSVSADDSNAGVSGSGSCGNGNLHCTGEGSCGSADTTTESGNGECSGDSDEFWDSGLYVNCSSEASSGSLSIPPVCPAVPDAGDMRLCTPDVMVTAHAGGLPLRACQIMDLQAKVPLCETEREPAEILNKTRDMAHWVAVKFRGSNYTISAHVVFTDGLATGFVCWGLDCKQVLPSCAPVADGSKVARCTVK